MDATDSWIVGALGLISAGVTAIAAHFNGRIKDVDERLSQQINDGVKAGQSAHRALWDAREKDLGASMAFRESVLQRLGSIPTRDDLRADLARHSQQIETSVASLHIALANATRSKPNNGHSV